MTMTTEIRCCGTWTEYPAPGRDTQCPACGTTWTVLGLLLETIEAKAGSAGQPGIERLAGEARELARILREPGNDTGARHAAFAGLAVEVTGYDTSGPFPRAQVRYLASPGTPQEWVAADAITGTWNHHGTTTEQETS
jgi:hypothetical protein